MTPEELKPTYDKLQEGLPKTKMAIRDGIVVDVGTEGEDDYPRFGYEFFCWRSPESTKEMDEFIKYASGKKCLLDIGAFHGIYSVVFAELNKMGTVYAFEPYYKPMAVLQKQIQGNDRVIALPMAITDMSGRTDLYEQGGHLNGGDLSPQNRLNATPISVITMTADSFCFGIVPNIAPDIIKIDVEGGEAGVLKGLQNVVAKHRPIIFLELHYLTLTAEQKKEIVDFITWYAYAVIDIETLLPMSPYDLLKNHEGEKRVILK